MACEHQGDRDADVRVEEVHLQHALQEVQRVELAGVPRDTEPGRDAEQGEQDQLAAR
jgi:hypothetical protein